MPSIFQPPIAYQNPGYLPTSTPIQKALFKYYGPYPVGQSIVGPYPSYRTVPYPSQLLLEGLADGVDYFLGGHVYLVSDSVASALIASGYGALVDTVQWNEVTGTWGMHSGQTWEGIYG